jgi:hypothetical protein
MPLAASAGDWLKAVEEIRRALRVAGLFRLKMF